MTKDIVDAVRNADEFVQNIDGQFDNISREEAYAILRGDRQPTRRMFVEKGYCDVCGQSFPIADLRQRTVEVQSSRSGESMTFVGDIFSFGNGGGKRGGARYNTGRKYYKNVKQTICKGCVSRENYVEPPPKFKEVAPWVLTFIVLCIIIAIL